MVRRIKTRTWLIVLIVLAVLGGVYWAGAQVYADDRARSEYYRATWEENRHPFVSQNILHRPVLLEDLRALRQSAEWTAVDRVGDSRGLNASVPWVMGAADEKVGLMWVQQAAETRRALGMVQLSAPPELRAALREWGSAFLDHAGEHDRWPLEEKWWAAVRWHEGWDLSSASPVALVDLSAADPVINFPSPDFAALRAAAKLRLMHGWARGELEEACEDARHVARLMISTQSKLGAMVAAQTFAALGQARGFAGPDAPETCDVGPLALARRAERALYAAPMFLHPWASPEEQAELVAEAPTAVLCPALGEALENAIMLRPHLDDIHWLYFDDLGQILENARECRLAHLRSLWEATDPTKVDRPLPLKPHGWEPPRYTRWPFVPWLPAYKAHLGAIAVQSLTHDAWRVYEHIQL